MFAVTTDTLLGSANPVTDALLELALELTLEEELRLELLLPPATAPFELEELPPPQALSNNATASQAMCFVFVLSSIELIDITSYM